jgi:hypothetical protein
MIFMRLAQVDILSVAEFEPNFELSALRAPYHHLILPIHYVINRLIMLTVEF